MCIRDSAVPDKQGETSTSLETDDISMVMMRNCRFMVQNVVEIIDLSKRNRFVPLPIDAKIRDSLKPFGEGIHRIAIIDNKKLSHIFSQSRFIEYLDQNIKVLGTEAEKTAAQLNIGEPSQNIVSISLDSKSIDAFKTLHSRGLSALAIVDSQGKLIDQLSASDLREISFYASSDNFNFKSLLVSVSEMLSVIKRVTKRPKHFLVQVHLETPLKDIIKIMVENRIHRVWLVDKDGVLDRVVSMTDIIRGLSRIWDTQ
eukprot:TRINITY_DN9024_c0_g1_i1.p1 TRINITY_DN9024_c0_g1~~TRINITY_DN9024_c0_g1_i1.p1  ORF type:complete len:257 (+),score=36.45 TRINITY_DN9024_c0_g1_i1:1-771(+)